jgi:GH35 family endo-1,4-beta-xylanase
VDEWDVLNEPYDNNDLMELLGDRVMVDWFHTARAVLPGTPLYMNDYSILAAGGRDRKHQEHFEQTARFLLENGAPLTGLGFQSHFGTDLTAPARVLALLDRYAELGLELKITEFDINTDDEQLQADYTRDFMTAAFSHPAVDGFFFWGFWAGAHWRPDAALFRQDWSPRPALNQYKKLVFDEWWTRLQGHTDKKGLYHGRGYYGAYNVIIEKSGVTVTQALEVIPDKRNRIAVIFPWKISPDG